MIGLGLGLNRGGPPKPFHPTDLGNLGFWRDKDKGILHSVSPDVPAAPFETVRRWQNLANPGVYDADQATGNAQPLFNSAHGGCTFDGVNDMIDAVYPIVGRGWCIFIAGHLPTQFRAYPRLISAFQQGGGDDYQSSTSFLLYYNPTASRFEVMHAEDTYVTASLAQNSFFRIILNCAGDGTLSLNLNGTTTVSGSPLPATINANRFRLGASNTGLLSDVFTGTVSRVGAYTTALTPAQITKIQNWL